MIKEKGTSSLTFRLTLSFQVFSLGMLFCSEERTLAANKGIFNVNPTKETEEVAFKKKKIIATPIVVLLESLP